MEGASFDATAQAERTYVSLSANENRQHLHYLLLARPRLRYLINYFSETPTGRERCHWPNATEVKSSSSGLF
jgi:hypothetical protein